jgi:ABC-type dipeptide/oligopeptide/nickel transport system ATPase component
MSLSLRQTLALRLTQQQEAFLTPYEKVLRERIHGKDIRIEKHHFGEEPILKFYEAETPASWRSVPMLDKEIVDDQIKGLSSQITPVSLYGQNANLYVNILYHYKSLASAYEANGKIYNNPALEEWQTHIIDFLGVLPDTWIAKIVSKTSSAISYYRNRLGIQSAAQNFDEEEIDKEKVLRIQAENLKKLNEFQATHENKSFSCATKNFIKNFIKENKQKTDAEIGQELQTAGISVARQSINKYRHEMSRGLV